MPYELEDVHPADVRGGGVTHFDRETYGRVKPLLAERMARYITIHGDHYRHMASFTDGRYGEVTRMAQEIAGVAFPVFPDERGTQVVRKGNSTPQKYWDKFWIQLYLEILSWLEPERQRLAAERLAELEVEHTGRDS